jgi:hypothetical protein
MKTSNKIWLVAIVAALITPVFNGCNQEASNKEAPMSDPPTVTLEEHDYFKVYAYGWTYTLAHKGNCRACDKRWEEFKNLIKER